MNMHINWTEHSSARSDGLAFG